MKFSLLYAVPEEQNEVSSDVRYEMSLDRTARAFCGDGAPTEAFLHVLSRPLLRVENIVHRQEIYRDFIADPALFDELKVAFHRYDRIRGDWLELRSGVQAPPPDADCGVLLNRAFASLKVTAVFPRTLLSFYENFEDILTRHPVQSSCLTAMRDHCAAMRSNRALGEVADIAARFRYHEAEDYHFSVLVSLDDSLRVCACDLTDIVEGKSDKEKKSLLRTLLQKKDAVPSVVLDDGAEDGCRRLTADALSRIDRMLAAITDGVYETFSGLSREMQFYDAAIAYAAHLTEWGMPLCFPKTEDTACDITEIHGLQDPFLVLEGIPSERIVGNDVSMQAGGSMLICGDNSTGKTVFLRALGTAQLFAQAGLPICAEDARLSVRCGIFAHFSSAEEDDRSDSPAGRFEGEVREIAAIMDAVRPHSLVLLNETFQTTAYREGAQGIYPILCALERLHCRFVFVTHLSEAASMVRQGNTPISLYCSGDAAHPFRIERVGGDV